MTDSSDETEHAHLSTVQVDPTGRFVLIKPVGRLTTKLAVSLIDDMLALPDFRQGMPSVWDLSDADLGSVSSTGIRSMPEVNRTRAETRGRARVALYGPSDLDYGIGRMYQVLGEVPHLEIAPFRNLDAAIAWVCGEGEAP